jgi:hypothetical protein
MITFKSSFPNNISPPIKKTKTQKKNRKKKKINTPQKTMHKQNQGNSQKKAAPAVIIGQGEGLTR